VGCWLGWGFIGWLIEEVDEWEIGLRRRGGREGGRKKCKNTGMEIYGREKIFEVWPREEARTREMKTFCTTEHA